MQDFFDLAVNNKTRPQIHEDLAKLAAQAAGVSQDAVLEQLSFPPGDPHPGSNISMVCLTKQLASIKELKIDELRSLWLVSHADLHLP